MNHATSFERKLFDPTEYTRIVSGTRPYDPSGLASLTAEVYRGGHFWRITKAAKDYPGI